MGEVLIGINVNNGILSSKYKITKSTLQDLSVALASIELNKIRILKLIQTIVVEKEENG